ncbi:rRNA maturation RNase YbeY [Aridibaculum aurantiacum]|uniref:rRNA maturation RNase YbeY n=1 Tax=Aridibaculum aurantiacum TaxID=2810307 RepID=UPI001A963269|nr:rRNA maturation RNase YbeY [Aridibaculum aurantiacum]
MSIRFSYADVSTIPLKNKKVVKLFIQELFQLENKPLSQLNYVFCSDEYLLQINKDHLQHDYYTDIITFDLTDPSSEGTIGEIYISVDRVKDNANDHKVTSTNELLRVIFHGALHLCGYGDKTNREITIMREKEDHYLRLFEKRL